MSTLGQNPLIDQLLALPVQQRGDIASILLRSIGEVSENRMSPSEWTQAIEHRSDALHSGTEDVVIASDSIAEARARITRARKS